MRAKHYYVYLMADRHRGTLYIGVTNDLERRLREHKTKVIEGFTSRYHADVLVYFEETTDVHAAIAREKQMKGWTRAKKVALIESANAQWSDLSEGWSQPALPPDSFAEMRFGGQDRGRRSE